MHLHHVAPCSTTVKSFASATAVLDSREQHAECGLCAVLLSTALLHNGLNRQLAMMDAVADAMTLQAAQFYLLKDCVSRALQHSISFFGPSVARERSCPPSASLAQAHLAVVHTGMSRDLICTQQGSGYFQPLCIKLYCRWLL